MKKFLDDNKKYILLWLIVRVVIASYVIISRLYLQVDSVMYELLGDNLLIQGKFQRGDVVEMNRTPIYPLLIAFCKLVAQEKYFVLLIVIQIMINFLGFYVWYQLTKLFITKRKTMQMCMLVYALDVQGAWFACMVLTDSISQFMVLLFVYLMMSFWRKEDKKTLFFAAVILGFGVLVRPIMQFLPFAMFIGISGVYLIDRKQLKKGLLYAILFLMISIIPMTVWSARNYYRGGEYTISNIGKVNMYSVYGPIVQADLEGRNAYDIIENERNLPVLTTEDLNNPEISRLGVDLVKAHPFIYAKYHLRGMVAQCFYPGIIDVIRDIGNFETIIDEAKQLIYQENGKNVLLSIVNWLLKDRPSAIIYGLFIGVDVLLLITIFCYSIRYMFAKSKTIWYEKWMLIGISAYFWICSGTPFGIGSYPRFRMPYLYLILLGIAIWMSEQTEKREIYENSN